MKTHPTVTAGDVGQVLDVQLGERPPGGDFVVIDFTGTIASVEAHVWPRNGTAATATLAANFTDEATGDLRVALGGSGGWLPGLAATVTRGKVVEYLIHYEVTFTDTSQRTWGPDVLPVQGQAA